MVNLNTAIASAQKNLVVILEKHILDIILTIKKHMKHLSDVNNLVYEN
jgi:hypothetical protein